MNSVADIVPIVSKITKHKLNGSNYIEWSKTIKIYLRSLAKDDHLTEEPPNDNTRKLWMQDDARLFLQIKNSINSDIVGLLSHCEFVKELMDYLDFFYFGKVRSKVLYPVQVQNLSIGPWHRLLVKSYGYINSYVKWE